MIDILGDIKAEQTDLISRKMSEIKVAEQVEMSHVIRKGTYCIDSNKHPGAL